MTILTGDLQVYAGIQIPVSYPTPHGHIRIPLIWIVADEVGHYCLQSVKGLQAWLRIGTNETQSEVDTFPWFILVQRIETFRRRKRLALQHIDLRTFPHGEP